MAIYHLNLSHGSRSGGQSAGAKLDYISREGKYAQQPDVCRLVESANLPSWAHSAQEFWNSADQYERANARLFSQLEFALPAELSPEGQLQLVREFAAERLERQPYTFAIHEGKGTNPHVHLIYSERIEDGIERSAETFFKRANKKSPELGGATKNRQLKEKSWLVDTREKWAEQANRALQNEASIWSRIQKSIPHIDHRTLEAQGIGREPQKHRGPERQGRIERQYQEVRYGMGRSNSGNENQMVARRTAQLNRREVERRAHQDIERNKQLKRGHQNPKERKRESLERTKELKRSIGKSEQLQQDGLQSVSRALEERDRNAERLQEEFTRDHQDISELLRRTQESCRESRQRLESERSRSGQRSLEESILSPRRTGVSNQLSLGDFKLPERKIKSCIDRERRTNPRMGQGVGEVAERVRSRTESIGDGFRKAVERTKRGIERVQNQLNRCVQIAGECFRRYGTALLNLADKTKGEIPLQTPLKGFTGPLLSHSEGLSKVEQMKSFLRKQSALDRKLDLLTHNDGFRTRGEDEAVKKIVDVLCQHKIGRVVLDNAEREDEGIDSSLKGMLWMKMNDYPADKKILVDNLEKINGGMKDLVSKATVQRVYERNHELRSSKKISPERPPEYVCPGLEEERQEKRELARFFRKQAENQQKRDEGQQRGYSRGF